MNKLNTQQILEDLINRNELLSFSFLLNNTDDEYKQMRFNCGRSGLELFAISCENQGNYKEAFTLLVCKTFNNKTLVCNCCNNVIQYVRMKNYLKVYDQVELDESNYNDIYVLYLVGKYKKKVELLFKVLEKIPVFYECMLEIVWNIEHPSENEDIYMVNFHVIGSNEILRKFLFIERSIDIKYYFNNEILLDTTGLKGDDIALTNITYNHLMNILDDHDMELNLMLVDNTYLAFTGLKYYINNDELKLYQLKLKYDNQLVNGIYNALKKKYDIAIECFKNYNGNKCKPYIYSWIGKMYEYLEDKSNAHYYLNKVEESNCNAMIGVISSYYTLGFYNETMFYSVNQISKYNSLDKPQLYKFIGRVYLKYNDYRNAVIYFKKAIEMNETDSYLYLAEVYKLDNNKEKVIECYKSYLECPNLPIKNKEKIILYLIHHFEDVNEQLSIYYKNLLSNLK
ncbi:hypothetical protein A0H76_2058 [Hepatospora eriocheir]|uniref:Uncharacterized protein n=1 Tax=Hepatospora eriocheir TaxID=1081669 RepID=A0A1X0QKE1_9MICR|nr:hypothetical protein A0H76_2058 [Hepatospora eriocheir]